MIEGQLMNRNKKFQENNNNMPISQPLNLFNRITIFFIVFTSLIDKIHSHCLHKDNLCTERINIFNNFLKCKKSLSLAHLPKC